LSNILAFQLCIGHVLIALFVDKFFKHFLDVPRILFDTALLHYGHCLPRPYQFKTMLCQ